MLPLDGSPDTAPGPAGRVESCPSAAELAEAVRTRIPGKNVLSVAPENILDYCCGSWALVERDVTAVLPAPLAKEVLSELSNSGVPDAFRVREELVNYKKVLLHVHQQGKDVERLLSQLASFFHEERVWCKHGISKPSLRRGKISDALMQCKGRCEATFDARLLGKQLCNLPRHPSKPPSAALQEMPASLRSWRIAEAAKADEDGAKRGAQPALPSKRCRVSWHEKVTAAIASQDWPEHIREFVRLVLICRGADKALRIRDELLKVIDGLEHCNVEVLAALNSVESQPSPEQVTKQLSDTKEEEEASEEERKHAMVAMKAAMSRQRHFNLLTGCTAPLRECLRWLRAIEQVADKEGTKLFVAGDGRGLPAVRYGARTEKPAAFCVPQGFEGGSAPEDQHFWSVIREHTPSMHEILAEKGWPEHICERLGVAGKVDVTPAEACIDPGGPAAGYAAQETETKAAVASSNRPACSGCSRKFSALWTNRGLCIECEGAARAAGRCPFSKACQKIWFCPHERRCLKCDTHSCDTCRFSRGDGEHVANLAAQLSPARIFLDFDRTLATTRSGGLPVVGKDTMDPELLSLMWERRGACEIVTRNSHVEEIRSFLAAQGAPPDVPVHSLKRPRSKAEFILPHLQEKEVAIFADDSVAELMDPELAGARSLYRVLFVRGLL